MNEPHQVVISIKAELLPVKHNGEVTGVPVFKQKELIVSDLLSLEEGKEFIEKVIKNAKESYSKV
jgi:hypothetical protein